MQSDALPEVVRQPERKKRSAKPLSIQVHILSTPSLQYTFYMYAYPSTPINLMMTPSVGSTPEKIHPPKECLCKAPVKELVLTQCTHLQKTS